MELSKNNNDKLEQVLQLFIIPDYEITTTTYLDLLLEHIIKEIKQDTQQIIQILQNWIITAFATWKQNSIPSLCVSVFTLKLLGALSANESLFIYLNQNNVHMKACSLFELESSNLNTSVKLAFTRMFSNLLGHLGGRKWLIESKTWKLILKFAQSNRTMYVAKESQNFLSVLLVEEYKNRVLCKEIIIAIVEPLLKVTSNSELANQHFIMDKKDLFEQHNLLLSTIELLLVIMDYVTFYDLENSIPEMFEEFTSLESRVNVIFEVTISTPMMKTVHKLVKLLTFTKLRSSVKNKGTLDILDENILRQFFARLYYNSMMLLSKKCVLELMISKKLGVLYWKKLKKLTNLEMPRPYKFEIQGIALMLLPLCVTMKPKYVEEHYLFEEFLETLFDVTSTEVQRMAYSIRDVILKNDFPMEHICKSTVDHLLEIIDIVDRDTAVIIFQTMCHALKNFVSVSKGSIERAEKSGQPSNLSDTYRKKKQLKHFLDGDPITDKQILLAALLNGLNVLTEKFKLKWQECVETICLLSIAQDILNHPGIDPKICTLALKTCKLAIQNFMPPNLVLLVDFDEHTKEIGPTLFKRIHDQNWEVQDSVLEVLNTITYLSEYKYPPYQNFLLENKFLEVAIEMINDECESYVRASALSFISTAVRINMLWEKQLSQMNLCELAIKLIYRESEAIARREAVVLLKELYRYRKWPKSVLSSMSETMIFAAVLDLHWEVKVNALEFWRDFIKSHLTDQGMLDGHFPSVTFSKEDRKIVSLNEIEIIQRLNKALDELSRQCCLGVLLVTLRDESDFEVSKTSANIIDELRTILLTYKINEPIPQMTLPKDSATMDTNYVRRQLQTTANDACLTKNNFCNIIEDIVDSNDANLLSSIYSQSMKMDSDNTDKIKKSILDYIGRVSRQEFLSTILNFDIDGYIKGRSEWLQNYTNSFTSVMEDILMISIQKDVTSMDCY